MISTTSPLYWGLQIGFAGSWTKCDRLRAEHQTQSAWTSGSSSTVSPATELALGTWMPELSTGIAVGSLTALGGSPRSAAGTYNCLPGSRRSSSSRMTCRGQQRILSPGDALAAHSGRAGSAMTSVSRMGKEEVTGLWPWPHTCRRPLVGGVLGGTPPIRAFSSASSWAGGAPFCPVGCAIPGDVPCLPGGALTCLQGHLPACFPALSSRNLLFLFLWDSPNPHFPAGPPSWLPSKSFQVLSGNPRLPISQIYIIYYIIYKYMIYY